MGLFNWLCKDSKKQVQECRTIPKKEAIYALHTAHKNYLLKGGNVDVEEELTTWNPRQIEFRQVALKKLYGASSKSLLVESINDIVLVENDIGHSDILALNGESINLSYLRLNQIQALAIIEDLGLEHEVTTKIIKSSLSNFYSDIKRFKNTNTEGMRSENHKRELSNKNYLFTSSYDLLYLSMQLK